MKAVIMAGGEGSRLRPLTSNTPKPMLPVANRPMMEHIVALCRRHGFTEIVATVQFLASVIRNHFGDGADFDVDLRYAVEESPLGTAGSVGNAREILDETFLVISGDALTDIDVTAAVDAHRRSGAIGTIVLYNAENPLEFGIVITREDGTIERFLEKPSWGQVFSDAVNTGIYVLEPEIFDFVPDDAVCDFSQDVFPAVLESGQRLFGHVADGYWEDVGNIDAYAKAHQDVLDGRVDVDIPGFKIAERVWVGADTEVHPDAVVAGPAVIGDNCRIGPRAVVADYTVLGSNVVVRDDAACRRSIVFDNAYVGRHAHLSGAIVAKGADIRHGARVEPGVVVGDGSFVGAEAVLNPAVRVYPFKTVEAGAIVNASVVWESRAARTLFGSRGVSGLANIDVTPHLAVRLAMAYGSTLKRGSIVTCSRDASRASRALRRAFMAGLNATGVHVDDLEVATVPLTRFYAPGPTIHSRSRSASSPTLETTSTRQRNARSSATLRVRTSAALSLRRWVRSITRHTSSSFTPGRCSTKPTSTRCAPAA
jgi:mannose-1-phosphate guanylyltransferase/phosphomannomutase